MKSWLKTQLSKKKDHGIQSHHFMQIDGETMEIVTDFIFLGFKITADGDGSHDIQRHLPLGRKAMKSQIAYHKANKVCTVKAIVSPVVLYGCESWTIMKAEH